MYLTITLDVALQEEWQMYLSCITGRMANVPNINI